VKDGAQRANQKSGMLRRGKTSLGHLGEEYLVKLDKLARLWGCETLSEAAMEILKDGIDDELKKDT